MSKEQLSVKDQTIVAMKVKGKTSQQIGDVLDMKAQSVRKRLQKSTVQDALQASLIKRGITIDKALKPIADALDASDPMYDKQGNYIDDRVNHAVRLQASDRARELLGIGKDQIANTDPTSLTPEELEQLASESDEIELTRLVFRRGDTTPPAKG